MWIKSKGKDYNWLKREPDGPYGPGGAKDWSSFMAIVEGARPMEGKMQLAAPFDTQQKQKEFIKE